jgi:hypothetical protein
MDLNYLLYRHQVSLDRSHNAVSLEARVAHAGFARHYADRIDGLRRTMFPANKTPKPLAENILYGAVRA